GFVSLDIRPNRYTILHTVDMRREPDARMMNDRRYARPNFDASDPGIGLERIRQDHHHDLNPTVRRHVEGRYFDNCIWFGAPAVDPLDWKRCILRVAPNCAV